MPLWIPEVALAVSAVASLVAGIWLLLNLPAVARVFSGNADLVPPPGRRHVSRGQVWAALIIFNAGWIACLMIWIFAMSGEANQVVDAAA